MKKKQVKQKTIIVKVPKAPKFDLSFSKTQENTRIIVALESLKSNPGWQFITQVIQGNIKYLADQIISKQGDNGVVLEDGDIDILRIKYDYLSEILKKPDKFLKELTRTESKEESLDPYQD